MTCTSKGSENNEKGLPVMCNFVLIKNVTSKQYTFAVHNTENSDTKT